VRWGGDGGCKNGRSLIRLRPNDSSHGVNLLIRVSQLASELPATCVLLSRTVTIFHVSVLGSTPVSVLCVPVLCVPGLFPVYCPPGLFPEPSHPTVRSSDKRLSVSTSLSLRKITSLITNFPASDITTTATCQFHGFSCGPSVSRT
jgi:hypothetical protein